MHDGVGNAAIASRVLESDGACRASVERTALLESCVARSLRGPAPARGHRLHIAFVTETYPPEVNGVALTVARTVDDLRARGHQVDLIRPRQRADSRESSAPNEFLLPGMPIPFYRDTQFGFPAPSRLRRRWRSDPPDLVHIATEGPLGWSALRAGLDLGIPVTSDYRTHFHRYSAHYGVGWLAWAIDGYLRRFHNRAHRTFVSTDALREELAAQGYRNLLTVGRGVDTTLFSPGRRSEALREAWGLRAQDLAALYVGRLADEKNPDLAAHAYERLREKHPTARMIWVGDGPARARLERAYPAHVFCGVVRGEALAAHYASADLFLFPSTTETFGNVTLEALASGLAVVAYAYGAAAQHAIDGFSARLVTTGDEDAFVSATLELASSPRLRAALRRAAPQNVADLAWPRILTGFESHLIACASQGQRACHGYTTT